MPEPSNATVDHRGAAVVGVPEHLAAQRATIAGMHP